MSSLEEALKREHSEREAGLTGDKTVPIVFLMFPFKGHIFAPV